LIPSFGHDCRKAAKEKSVHGSMIITAYILVQMKVNMAGEHVMSGGTWNLRK
jgi:hypothetical protein